MSARITTTAYYRPIFRSALHHVFGERDAWFFGIFAFVFGSGSALETVLRVRRGLAPITTPFLQRIFPWMETAQSWWSNTTTLSPIRIVLTLLTLVLLGIFFLRLSLLSQSILIHGAKPRPKFVPTFKLTAHAKTHLWRVLEVNIFGKLLILLPILLLLTPEVQTPGLPSDVLAFLRITFGYGLLFFVSLATTFALIEVINYKSPFTEAYARAITTIQSHAISVLELSFLLFLLNAAAGFFGAIGLLLLSLPYTVFVLLGAASGSFLAISLVTTLTLLLVVALAVVLTGSLTAYNYAVLTAYYTRIRSGRFKSKWHRLKTTRYWF